MPDFAFWNNWSKKSSQFATSLSREYLIIKALLAMESIQVKDRGEDEDEDGDKSYKIQQSTCSCKELLCELRRLRSAISRLKASVSAAALRTSNQFWGWRFWRSGQSCSVSPARVGRVWRIWAPIELLISDTDLLQRVDWSEGREWDWWSYCLIVMSNQFKIFSPWHCEIFERGFPLWPCQSVKVKKCNGWDQVIALQVTSACWEPGVSVFWERSARKVGNFPILFWPKLSHNSLQ